MQKGAIYKISVGTQWVSTLALLASPLAQADTTSPFNSADTAWMLSSTALVPLMTVPGLALFYAGMVRKKKASRNGRGWILPSTVSKCTSKP